MFTIKHVEPCGAEHVHGEITGTQFSPMHVEAVKPRPADQPASTYRDTVYAFREGGAMLFDEGSIYLMNSNGKTVAKYDLGTRTFSQDVPQPPAYPAPQYSGVGSTRIA